MTTWWQSSTFWIAAKHNWIRFTKSPLWKSSGDFLALSKTPRKAVTFRGVVCKGNTAQRLCDRCVVKFFVRWNKKRSEYLMYSRAFLWNMTGNLQADGVQSRQTLFVRYCPEETLHKARLTALHAICLQIFRHIAQKSLAIRQYACGISVQSAEKSDYASYAQALCSVS